MNPEQVKRDTRTCGICAVRAEHPLFYPKEMMFGYRDEFEYFECVNCGCLQISAIPDNLARYYPADFYAYRSVPVINNARSGLLRSFLLRQRTLYRIYHKNLIGAALTKLGGQDYFGKTYEWSWFKKAGVRPSSKILDVGCGGGALLHSLSQQGFTDLTGVDPFIEKDINRGGVKIYKKHLTEIDDKFDFVMLHHSFEHIPSPIETIKALKGILKPKAHVLIRIPVASYAWETYRINWVQLDAPRHLFLHTEKSMRLLAEQADLKITDIDYDSSAMQFWGSEQYVQGIPLRDPKSYSVRAEKPFFTEEQIKSFEAEAQKLNAQRKGDQACFYLYNG